MPHHGLTLPTATATTSGQNAFSNFDGLDSVLSQFGVSTAPPVNPRLHPYPHPSNHVPHAQSNQLSTHQPPDGSGQSAPNPTAELLHDFQYVTVCETDEDEVDIVPAMLEGGSARSGADGRYSSSSLASQDTILAVLLSAHEMLPSSQEHPPNKIEKLSSVLEQANNQAQLASLAKQRGDLQQAIDAHTGSARRYLNAASLVSEENRT
jgi:hypothetical protein